MTESKRKVVVVDDTAIFGLTMSLEFRAAGWDVYCCGSAADALKKLAGTHYDLVISDLNMPGMGGIELALELKKKYPTTKVILMSSQPRDRVQGLPPGVPFLEKPVKVKMVLEAFENACRAPVPPPPPKA